MILLHVRMEEGIRKEGRMEGRVDKVRKNRRKEELFSGDISDFAVMGDRLTSTHNVSWFHLVAL